MNSVNISYILKIDKEKVHQWTTLSAINVAPQNTYTTNLNMVKSVDLISR
jgi:hypothetical protein